MKGKWIFCGIAALAWFVGAFVIPPLWLESDETFSQALSLFSVAQNSFTLAMVIAGGALTCMVVYIFIALPQERQQKTIIAWMPLAFAIGLIIALPVPVKSDGYCGHTHSMVPLAFAPVFLVNPDLHAPIATYEADAAVELECD
jgi:ABC-type Fe3+ transport system permease subunit